VKKYFYFGLILASLASCKKDKDNGDDPVIPNTTTNTPVTNNGAFSDFDFDASYLPKEIVLAKLDAQTVTNSITIEGSTKTAGAPPSPTNTSESPVLEQANDGDPIATVEGKKFTQGLNVSVNDIKGVYLKLPGSDSYFTIPVKTDFNKSSIVKTNMKREKVTLKSDDESIFFEVQLPDNVNGTFCYNYCVYDSAGNISNVVEQCIEVNTIGGNLPFNVTKLNLIAYISKENNDIYYEYVGEKLFDYEEVGSDAADSTKVCGDGSVVEAKYIILKETYLELRTDGSYTFKSSDETVYPKCPGENKDSVTDEYEGNGYWSYDENLKTLRILDPDYGYDDVKVTVKGNDILLSFEEDDEYEGYALWFTK
jgi:hypothetical protein